MPWIQTYTGKVFDVRCPSPESIDLEDIAHALSMICRYNGHTTRFYSVAEHCVVMSRMVDEDVAFEALMHDAAEAYVSDLTRPVKQLVPAFEVMESRITSAIRHKFGLRGHHYPVEVTVADHRMLATERPQVMAPCARDWANVHEPYSVTLECWPPDKAELAFLSRYSNLITRQLAV